METFNGINCPTSKEMFQLLTGLLSLCYQLLPFQTSCYPNDFCYESIFVTIFRNRTMQKVTERIVKELFEYAIAVVVFSGELRA